jgi:hypothetical protein
LASGAFWFNLVNIFVLFYTVDDDMLRVGSGVKGNILVRGPPCFGGERIVVFLMTPQFEYTLAVYA